MRGTAPLSFDHLQDRVEAMMERGASFSIVEESIDEAYLSRDQKAALWLLAWSLRDPEEQRRDARWTVSWLGGPQRAGNFG